LGGSTPGAEASERRPQRKDEGHAIDRAEPGFEVDGARFSACVREAAAEQVRRGAGDVPQAVVLVKIYGCQGGAM
jgi:hypothetical protein